MPFIRKGADLKKNPKKGIKIDERDLKIETFHTGYKSSVIHQTNNAVRITHLPTGTTIESSEERSQIMNRAKAMKELSEILEKMPEENCRKISEKTTKKEIEAIKQRLKSIEKIQKKILETVEKGFYKPSSDRDTIGER
jgi:protein subunit release factor A